VAETVMNGAFARANALHGRRRRQRGAAAAELAVTMPFLFLLMLGAVDFGRIWTVSTRIADAAYSGAAYGAQTSLTAKDTEGIRDVVFHELGIDDSSSSALTFAAGSAKSGTDTPSSPTGHSTSGSSEQDYNIGVFRYCECEDGESIDCELGSCVAGSGNRRVYVRVRVGTTFETVFDYPGVPSEIVLLRQTQMRAR
jgi:Flp pilus assembly protein TadG